MQYVGSPQTTFRFGSTPTRSMSISSLASMVESGEDPEDGDGDETAAHFFSRRFSVSSLREARVRRTGSMRSLTSSINDNTGSVGNLAQLGSSVEAIHSNRPPRHGRAQSARGGMLAESLGRQLSSRSVSQSPTSNPASPHNPGSHHQPGTGAQGNERRSSLGGSQGGGHSPKTRVVGFGEGATTTTSPETKMNANDSHHQLREEAFRDRLAVARQRAPDDEGGGDGDGEGADLGADLDDDAYETASDFFPRSSNKSAKSLVLLLHCVSFTSALIIAAPLPLLPQAVSHLRYSPVWTGLVFGAFAIGTVGATKAFNSFTDADGGRAALMIVGLFLQGAGGMLFGVAGELGFTNGAYVLLMFIACRCLVGVGVATAHLAVYAAINGSMGSDPARLKRTLKINELFVALGFAVAGPLVAWLSVVGDSYTDGGDTDSNAKYGNNPNGSATNLGVGGFRLPFQVTGFFVLGNAVWLAGDPGCLAAGTRREWLDALLEEEFESVEARAAELSAQRAERGEALDNSPEERSSLGGGGGDHVVAEVPNDRVVRRRELLTPRFVSVGGALFLACLSFGLVQPQLSLYLVEQRGFAPMANGLAQFAVAGGYILGLLAADLVTAMNVISAETVCAAGIFVSGGVVAALGAADGFGDLSLGYSDATMFWLLAAFGGANANALAPALDGMKRAANDEHASNRGGAASSVANVTEGAVRAFNVFQDAGQVLGPVLGGVLCAYAGGFANAALALGAFVCLYGALALSFRVSLMRPVALDGPVVLSAAAVSGGGRHPGRTRSNPRLPPAFPTKSENSLDEQLLHYDGSAESSAYTG